MEAFPSDDLANDIQNLDLDTDKLLVQRSLRIVLDVESDCFTFKVFYGTQSSTQRGLLSTVNGIFDPLGFAAPVVIGDIFSKHVHARYRRLGWPLIPTYRMFQVLLGQ